jgi:hypothetical protein
MPGSNPRRQPVDWNDSSAKASELSVKDIGDMVNDKIKIAFSEHETMIAEKLDELIADLKQLFVSGFPDGDSHGHRKYHEQQIEYMQERVRLWRSIREKTLAGLIWVGLGWLATASWHHLLSALRKTFGNG